MGLDAKNFSAKIKSYQMVDRRVCVSGTDACICMDVPKQNIRSSLVRSEPSQGGNVEVAGESPVPLFVVAVVVYGWDWMQKLL